MQRSISTERSRNLTIHTQNSYVKNAFENESFWVIVVVVVRGSSNGAQEVAIFFLNNIFNLKGNCVTDTHTHTYTHKVRAN